MRPGAVLWLALALLVGCAVADNAVDRMTVQLDGPRMVLSGEITSRTPAHFIAALNENPQVEVIVPFDMAGSVDEMAVYRMGDAIRTRGLDTHLTAQSEIYSGAVNLFLAGNRRRAPYWGCIPGRTGLARAAAIRARRESIRAMSPIPARCWAVTRFTGLPCRRPRPTGYMF